MTTDTEVYLSLYQCVKCGEQFRAGHYRAVRQATGRTVEHCGEPATWLKNLDKYDIRQANSHYELWDIAGSPEYDIKLGTYTTKEDVEKSRKQWFARDAVSDKIEDFIDELIAEYSEILNDDEIRSMISEQARP